MLTPTRILAALDTAVDKVTRWGVITGLSTLFVLLLMRVLARATEIAFTAYDEIGELATIWMILLGVVALWRKRMLYRVDVIIAGDAAWKGWLEVFVQLVSLGFAAIMAVYGWQYAVNAREMTAILDIDKVWYYGALPFCCAVMGIYSVVHLVEALRDALARGTGGAPVRPVPDTGETAIKHL
ncbi:TRAP transporter small permease [Salipiger sp.]|uniref:TRAP transporter small permease n=1 Tax=Salipiger sp. TaxID=2078585 RepID=UPI003A979DB9